MAIVHWRWIAQDGLNITGTDEVAGYNVGDFFDADLRQICALPPNAAYEALLDAYKGPDRDGVALYWTIDGCDRGKGLGRDDDDGPDDDITPPGPKTPIYHKTD